MNKSLSLELETPSAYISEDALGKIYLKVSTLNIFCSVSIKSLNMSDVILYSYGLPPNNNSQDKIFLKFNRRRGVLYKVKESHYIIF